MSEENCVTCGNNSSESNHILFIIPLYKSRDDIGHTIANLKEIQNITNSQIGLVLVSDGEEKADLDAIIRIVKSEFSFTLVELTRNFGVSAAIHAGLERSDACITIVCGADMQEPISLYIDFINEMNKREYEVIVGARESRKEYGFISQVSRIHWHLYRIFISNKVPVGGYDVFAISRPGKAILGNFSKERTFILPQLDWSGIDKKFIMFRREARKQGKSAWTFYRKLKLFFDIYLNFGNAFYKLTQYNLILLFLCLSLKAVIFDNKIILSLISILILSLASIIVLLLLNINSKINSRPNYLIKKVTNYKVISD